MTSMPSELLELNDEPFISALIERYPRGQLLAGPAESSPEGSPTLNSEALAHDVFPDHIEVAKTAVEAERTFFGLLLFKDVMNNDPSRFPNLSAENFETLRQTTLNIVQTEEDLELMLYSLTAQDLGKTQHLVDEYEETFGRTAEDHDKLIYELTKHIPESFEGFSKLSEVNKDLYLEGLKGDLNLGQYVQGECLPANLELMTQISDKARETRLLTEIYDFAGVTGHISLEKSIVMTDDNYVAFSSAIESLSHPVSVETRYNDYIESRAKLAGVLDENASLEDAPENIALARITCLTRTFDSAQGEEIKEVWDMLPDRDKNVLISEMEISGTRESDPKGILVYYAPALLGNHIKAAGDFKDGLYEGLTDLSHVYQEARMDMGDQTGPGVETVNVNALAKQALAPKDDLER